MKNREKYYKFELNMTLANILCISELVIFFLLNNIYSVVDLENINVFYVILLIILYTAIHEMFHGIAFRLFAGKMDNIRFGVLLEKGVFYAACQEMISKKGIIISLLFPLIFLSIVPLPLAIIYRLDILLILIVYNFMGAIGDILMTLFVLRLPKNTKYIDYDITVGATFISEDDLSKYSGKIMKLIDSGKHEEKNIDKSVKRFYISKKSAILFIVLVVIFIIDFIVDML